MYIKGEHDARRVRPEALRKVSPGLLHYMWRRNSKQIIDSSFEQTDRVIRYRE